ncbi:MAG TPA: membrane protein insertase YidC [Chitinophagaceae bacterium]|nr:membrane protein insertase YidC [Chitinophagaceae bacterium]
MDRNTIIGFVLLALLFLGYFYYSSQGRLAAEQQQKHIQDSINALKAKTDTSKQANTVSSVPVSSPAQNIQQDSAGKEQFITVENKVLKITFTSKGGQPKEVELKAFKTFDSKPLILQDGNFDNISYAINAGTNITYQTSDLLFTPSQTQTLADGSQAITFTFQLKNGDKIEHEYVLHPDNYMIDFTIKVNGADNLFTQNQINLLWQSKARKQEKDISWETQQSQVCFVENDDYDFERIIEGRSDDKKLNAKVDWVALRQQFFASTLIAKNKFESAQLNWESPSDSKLNIIAKLTANLRLAVPQGNNVQVPLGIYYGPDDYKILKSYGNQMYNMVPLGSGIFAFVKYINRGFILPVFNFLSNKIQSYGLIIALLTIVIRLLISPLTYQSYLSGAKMKLLKPELDGLRAKYADDKQAFGMEQMKLFRSAGVNPLGGCIPALLQIPIFFALYNFFNSNINLRGQSFLWAKDLSSYDSIYNFSFSIPFYGNHISLFTILAVATSLLISLYGMSNMQDNSNPLMKYMPFIFPVILLGVFNRLPSALTWYYTVSNTITLLIQFVIQQYIIDHDKILAKLQENKKKPVTQSKWQERISAMQETNKKLQEMQRKTNASKKK